MATLDVKFTKFDNRPWGFRLAGGSDFPEPLTVIRVTEGSLAECMGLKVGDVVVKLNDQPISDLTHGQAHEALMLAGNNFVLGVRRTEDPNKAIEGIEEKIEPYMLPIEEILFAPIEEKRETTPDEAPQIEDESVPPVESEAEQVQAEIYPEKPRDENSEIVPNTNLTDEEIAQLILDEEEVLNEKGVLGVNFKKLRPRAPLLRESKVFQELQQEANSESAENQELKHRSTFLQKPDRPVPKPRLNSQSEDEVEPYRVIIKKQPKKSVTERLLQKGLLEPSRVKTPETTQASEVNESDPDTTTPLKGAWSFTSYVDDDILTSETIPVEDETIPAEGETNPIEDETVLVEVETISIVGETSPIEDETVLVEVETISIKGETMLPINEGAEDLLPSTNTPSQPAPTITCASTYDKIDPPTYIPIKRGTRPRLCRRGRYAKRCLNRALESLKTPSAKTKPRLLQKGRYFERIVRDIKRSISGEKTTSSSEDSLLRILMLASLACSIRDTYDAEILHRGSSRRNSRRMSYRRESNAKELNSFESDLLAFKAKQDSDSLTSFQSRCAEGRRRLSVISMVVADKVSSAMRTDIARGLAYALVPCASALAFFMFNYTKRFNKNQE